MKTLKILPQTIFKFKCKQQLLKETLETLKNDDWVEHDEKWKVLQSKDTRLNKDPKYSDIHSWVRECFNKVKDELKFRCSRIEITQSWANCAKENQWQWNVYGDRNLVCSCENFFNDVAEDVERRVMDYGT